MAHKPFISNAMLIDDGEADQVLYKMVLENSGEVANVISYTYADEALEFLKQQDRPEIDVIFLDINMPRMDGFEFLEAATEEIGKDFADAVVIMLTTSLDPKDHERAKSYAVVKQFINKPLTVDHVKGIVKELKDQAPL